MLEDTDVILTADHGMTQLDRNKKVYLDDYVTLSHILRIVTYYPVLLVYPKPGRDMELFDALSNMSHVKYA